MIVNGQDRQLSDADFTVAFDADDTLWHNERAFARAEQRFTELVSPWADAKTALEELFRHERSRVHRYGYGVKSFALSMIAAACEISSTQIPSADLAQFVKIADDLLAEPTKLIDAVTETLTEISAKYPTMIITKGDLHHQLRRVSQSGADLHCFDVEVVAEKDEPTYKRILDRHGIKPQQFIMVGNSIVSDVTPVLEVGGRAIHVPYEITWALETADVEPQPSPLWRRVDSIREVPSALEELLQ